MNRLKTWIILVIAAWSLAACAPARPSPAAPTVAPIQAPTNAPVNNPPSSNGPQNATYIIDGQPVTLVNGSAEQEAAPGSASKKVTKYFGDPVELDLNGDGLMDTGLILTQEGGGSGTFVYVAAALQQAGGSYQGTNAILLGDRIAPQSTNVDPNNAAQFIVNYADRKASEPMSSQPTIGVSRTFKVDNGSLVEVGTPPSQVP